MRVHASVACTMLLAGMMLFLAPVLAWAYAAKEATRAVPEPPAIVVLVSATGVLVGLVLITSAVLLSVQSRETSDKT